jgi:predicted PurR-regulated permease PerM
MPLPPPTEKQARLIWLALTGLAIATIVALIAALIWGLGHVLRIMSPVLWPLAVAGVLACLLDPVVDLLVRRKVPRPRAIIVVFALAMVILTALLASVVPQLVSETRDLTSRMPAYRERLQKQTEHWISHPPEFVRKYILREPTAAREAAPESTVETNSVTAATELAGTTGAAPAPPRDAPTPSPRWSTLDKATLSSASSWVARVLPAVGNWLAQVLGAIASTFGIIAGLALIPIYAFYFLLEKHGITAQWHDYLPVRDSRFKVELVFVINAINEYLIAFFRGQVLVAICDGVLYTVGFLIIGLPYAVLIGAMATCLTIIPFLGAITTCVTALIVALVAFGDWQHPALVAAVFAVVQTLEGFVIQPKIMGDRVGLHPLTIIIALMVGTTLLGGILGGILAIPLTAALRVIMTRYIWKGQTTSDRQTPAT